MHGRRVSGHKQRSEPSRNLNFIPAAIVGGQCLGVMSGRNSIFLQPSKPFIAFIFPIPFFLRQLTQE